MADIFKELSRLEKDYEREPLSRSIDSTSRPGIEAQLRAIEKMYVFRESLQSVLTITNSLPFYDQISSFTCSDDPMRLAALDHLAHVVETLLQAKMRCERFLDPRLPAVKGVKSLDELWGVVHKRDQRLYLKCGEIMTRRWKQTHIDVRMKQQFRGTNQDIRAQIDQILQDRDRLLARTRKHRSGREIAGIGDTFGENDMFTEIFDDSDFYRTLCRKEGCPRERKRHTKRARQVHEKMLSFASSSQAYAWDADRIDNLFLSLPRLQV